MSLLFFFVLFFTRMLPGCSRQGKVFTCTCTEVINIYQPMFRWSNVGGALEGRLTDGKEITIV